MQNEKSSEISFDPESIENRESLISSNSTLPPEELHKVLIEWNSTFSEYPKDTSLTKLFEEQASRFPHAPAIFVEEQVITYAELNARANQLARYLISVGLSKESSVALCLERSTNFIIGVLAILKAEAVYVPLDPSYPKERLQFILEETKSQLVLTEDHFQKDFSEIDVKPIVITREENAIAEEDSANLEQSSSNDKFAYIMYTSGSTGAPKGVCITRRSILRLVLNTDYCSLNPDDKVAHLSNVAFDAATFEIWGPLLNGASLIIVPQETALSPHEFEIFLRHHNITVAFVTTALFNRYVSERPAIFSSLKTVMFGGEAVDPASVYTALTGGPPERLLHVYGPTESTTFATWYLIQEVTKNTQTIPIGKPISNTTTYVLDSNYRPVDIGAPGELCIGGDGLASGYLNDPEMTDRKFISNPFSNNANERLYKTGDWVRYLPTGDLEFLGRIDNQVKLRGFRIELGEIEAVLIRHPLVNEAVVLLREENPDNKRLAAFIASEDPVSLSAHTFKAHLGEKLPTYMIPADFVFLDTLPLTANGKVNRRALQSMPIVREKSGACLTPPRTDEETELHNIWQSLLGTNEIGIHENFFDLGGHSLIATRLISRVHTTFSVKIPLHTIFKAPTIAQLAQEIQCARKSTHSKDYLPIVLVPRDTALPLSFAQQRLWFLAQLAPNSSAYNIAFKIHLTGPLNENALETAINYVVNRHEALRTTFKEVDGHPIQCIAPPQAHKLIIVDLSATPSSERETTVQEIENTEARYLFDLSKESLFRTKLIRLHKNESLLCIVVHHIIFDGWSVDVLHREIASCYEQAIANKVPSLPELPIQFADYSSWQLKQYNKATIKKELEYWQKTLSGELPKLNLATDHPRPPAQTFQGACVYATIPSNTSEALKRLARETGTTLFSVLSAAWQTLLHRYSGQDDIIIGTGISGRDQAEVEPLVGFFVNTVALRTIFTDQITFIELVNRVHQAMLNVQEHQHMPLEQLVETLLPDRDTSRSPLFQVMFVLQNTPSSELQFVDISSRIEHIHNGGAKFDLVLDATESKDFIHLKIEYNTNLFNSNTVARMLSHYKTILISSLDNPGQSISTLDILSSEEKNQILLKWNETQVAFDKTATLHELFELQVLKSPESNALSYQLQSMTYRELNNCANQLAKVLKDRGAGPNQFVGVYLERSLEMIIALLAILKSGSAFVPVDPDYPDTRNAMIINDSNPIVILTQSALRPKLNNINANVKCLAVDLDTLDTEEVDNSASGAKPDDIAYVIYTSGSTGIPKGVMVSHKAICNHMLWMQNEFQLTQNDRVLQKTSLSFDASVWECFSPLFVGGCLIIAEPGAQQDPEHLVQLIRRESVTLLKVVPSLLRMLLNVQELELCTSLRSVFCGGEPLPNELVQKFHRILNSQLHNLYGPTEAAIDATFMHSDRIRESNTVTIGRAISNMQTYILDPKMQPVPIGVRGELFLGGVGLACGYLNAPELTKQRFLPNPFSVEQSNKLYKTGDIARYLPTGEIEFLGRADNQVKLRGFRIELGEIESILIDHPVINESVALLIEDSSGEKRIVAYVVAQKQKQFEQNELRVYLQARLPEYMIPSLFIMLDTLPLTPNGKVDRRALPAPDYSDLSPKELSIAPRTEVEVALAEIWKEVLNLDQVGVLDNFFSLGGHSLSAVRVMSKIYDTFQIKWNVSRIFNLPTIEALALALEEAILDEIESDSSEHE